MGLAFVITGLGILKLKGWARLVNIIIALCVVIFGVLAVFNLCINWRIALAEPMIALIFYGPAFFPSLIFIIFFTRPKVKEQFK